MEIKNYCREVCKFEVSWGWVNSFISRRSAGLTEQKFSTRKAALASSANFPEETMRTLHVTLKRCPADLVSNLDEVAISD
jgi:hypothetical protein